MPVLSTWGSMSARAFGFGIGGSVLNGLWAWGDNSAGQLGLGNLTSYSSPQQVGAITTWASVATGAQDTIAMSVLATKTDGTLWSWGNNSKGQLGLGNTTSYSSPKQVGALTTWSQVTTGRQVSAAIKTDGTLWTWGYGVGGSLGLGNTTSYSSPKQVGALTTWKQVSAGGLFFIAAVKTDGSIWSWGRANYGQLGLGTTTDYSSPKQIGALTTWSSVSCGFGSVLAVKTDGTLWGWGFNTIGQLGVGNNTNYSSPKQVGALTTWKAVATSYLRTHAVKTDGTLWAWGSGNTGQLGLGNTTSYSSPVQVGALTNWATPLRTLNASVVKGGYSSGAIKTDRSIWVWGNNNLGQLGLGNLTNYSSPKQVGSSTWKSAGLGSATIAIQG